MNPDVTAFPPPDHTSNPLPPTPVRTAALGFLVAAGLSLVAALLGLAALGADAPLLSTARLVLAFAGAVTAGVMVTKRPGDWWAWAGAAVVLALTAVGLPGHWDSARLVAWVAASVAAAGAVLAAVPVRVRYGLVSAWAVFHFVGLLTAVTGPSPTPWLTSQASANVYTQYLSFLYMKNAYHFYSPDPGPSTVMFFLVTYDTGETDPKTGRPLVQGVWHHLPERRTQYKDPLGLTYFRRLSLCELASASEPTAAGFERSQAEELRRQAAFAAEEGKRFPFTDLEPADTQYRVPRSDLRHHVLESYCRHVAREFDRPRPGWTAKSVKLYKAEHRVVPAVQFLDHAEPGLDKRDWFAWPYKPLVRDGLSPFDPTLFHPYFSGEYDAATGRLVNDKDPLLYWLVPVVDRPAAGAGEAHFTDYMSRHAGYEFNWKEVAP